MPLRTQSAPCPALPVPCPSFQRYARYAGAVRCCEVLVWRSRCAASPPACLWMLCCTERDWRDAPSACAPRPHARLGRAVVSRFVRACARLARSGAQASPGGSVPQKSRPASSRSASSRLRLAPPPPPSPPAPPPPPPPPLAPSVLSRSCTKRRKYST